MSGSHSGAYLKSAVQDLEERVQKLRLFDKKEEINVYCDELQSQVLLTIESMIATVNRLQNELIDEIESYRSRLIETTSVSADTKAENDKSKQLKRELARLTNEIEQFNTKCSAHFDKESVEDAAFQTSMKEADEFKNRARELRRQQRQQLFNGQFLKFNEGLFGQESSEFFARLGIFSQDVEDELNLKHFVFEENYSKMKTIAPSDLGFGDRPSDLDFQATVFISDDQVAVSLSDRPIFVMHLHSKCLLYQLEPVTVHDVSPLITSMVLLPNGQLAAITHSEPNQRNNIIIWSLETRKHVRTIQLAFECIAFKATPNGSLVCLCKHKIVFVDLNRKTAAGKCKVFNIPLQCDELNLIYAVLSNGQLVILFEDETYMIWDLEARKLVKSGQVFKGLVGDCKVLPNGHAVMYLPDGRVLMHDLISDRPIRAFYQSHGRVIDSVLQPDNSIMFIHLKSSTFELERDGFVVHTDLLSDHIYYSPDRKWLACGELGLTYWPLHA